MTCYISPPQQDYHSQKMPDFAKFPRRNDYPSHLAKSAFNTSLFDV